MRRKKLKLEDIYELIEDVNLKTPLYFRRFRGYTPKQYINDMYQISKWIARIKEPTFVIAELALKDYYRFEVVKEYGSHGLSVVVTDGISYFHNLKTAYALYDAGQDVIIGCEELPLPDVTPYSAVMYENILNSAEVKFLDLVFDKVNFLKQKQESAERKEKAKVLREDLINIYKKELYID